MTLLDAFLQELQEDHHQVEVGPAGEGDERGQGDEDQQHPSEEGVVVARAQEDETAPKNEEKYEETVESVEQHQPENVAFHQEEPSTQAVGYETAAVDSEGVAEEEGETIEFQVDESGHVVSGTTVQHGQPITTIIQVSSGFFWTFF